MPRGERERMAIRVQQGPHAQLLDVGQPQVQRYLDGQRPRVLRLDNGHLLLRHRIDGCLLRHPAGRIELLHLESVRLRGHDPQQPPRWVHEHGGLALHLSVGTLSRDTAATRPCGACPVDRPQG
jgi:hypothetical protein